MRRTLLLAALVFAVAAAPAAAAAPYENPKLPVSKRVDDLLSRMSLEEKVGQMTQTERFQFEPDANEPRAQRDADHDLRARLGPVRRRLDAGGRQHARRRGPTWSTSSSAPRSRRA